MLSILVIAITIIGIAILAYQQKPLVKNILKIVIVVEIIGLIIFAADYFHLQQSFNHQLQRNKAGEGDYEQELEVTSGSHKENVTIHVEEQPIDQKKAKQYFAKAKKEIDQSFLGENESYEEIYEDVVLKNSYVNDAVAVDWTFTPFDAVDTNGKVQLKKNLYTATAIATMKCGEYSEVYTFVFLIKKLDINTQKGFTYYLNAAIEKSVSNVTSNRIVLPTSLHHVPLQWSKPIDHRGEEITILGFAAGILYLLSEKEKKKKEEEIRRQKMSMDYVRIVDEMSLYIGAGIGMRETLQRMNRRYQNRLQEAGGSGRNVKLRPGYEEIAVTVRELDLGVGEWKAYESMGLRSRHKDFRKLSFMMTQNLKKGERYFAKQLEQEVLDCFEKRKNEIRIKGEEASTKLLFPMLGILIIMIVILIVPALQGMKM